MALTNAEKQARWREPWKAALHSLREQAAALKAGPDLSYGQARARQRYPHAC